MKSSMRGKQPGTTSTLGRHMKHRMISLIVAETEILYDFPSSLSAELLCLYADAATITNKAVTFIQKLVAQGIVDPA